MTAEIIDGRAHAARLRGTVADAVATLKARGVSPGLAVVLVGEDPASQVYVRTKHKQSEECGIASFVHRLPAETSEAELLSVIDKLNLDPAVHGILCQLPVPKQIDGERVINAIAPEKDVDGFTIANVGRLWTGQDAMVPCTPLGALMMLRGHLGDLSGAEALVVGRSNIVGKPMAQLLLRESCTVTVAHSRSRDLPELCRRAEILVAAVGRPEMVRGDWVKPGATVIDVGINRVDNGAGGSKLVGDVHFGEAVEVAGAITPVPGGAGPMTVACLLANTVTAAARIAGVAVPEGLTA